MLVFTSRTMLWLCIFSLRLFISFMLRAVAIVNMSSSPMAWVLNLTFGCFSRNVITSVTLWGSTSMLKLAITSSPNLRGSSRSVVFVIMPRFWSLRYLLMMVSTLTWLCLAMSLYFVRASRWRFRRMVMSILSIFCLAISIYF